MASRRTTLDLRTAVLLTLPPLFWAGNAVVGRALVGLFPPLALSFTRWLIAAAVLLPWVWPALWAQRRALVAHWKLVTLVGALGIGCYNTFQYLALQTSPAINVTLIAASMPVFVLATGALFFGEPARGGQWAGAALSLAGVVWVLARGEPARLLAFQFAPGDLIMLAANLTWTFYTWLLRTRRPDISLGPFLQAQIVVGTIAIAPLAAAEAVTGSVPITWNATTIGALAYVGIFPSLVAYYAWARGVARVGAVLPIYFANLTPIFAGALSTLLLGETPQVYHAVGLALIVAGIHLASRQRSRGV